MAEHFLFRRILDDRNNIFDKIVSKLQLSFVLFSFRLSFVNNCCLCFDPILLKYHFMVRYLRNKIDVSR